MLVPSSPGIPLRPLLFRKIVHSALSPRCFQRLQSPLSFLLPNLSFSPFSFAPGARWLRAGAGAPPESAARKWGAWLWAAAVQGPFWACFRISSAAFGDHCPLAQRSHTALAPANKKLTGSKPRLPLPPSELCGAGPRTPKKKGGPVLKSSGS